jgi:hypothetical protein
MLFDFFSKESATVWSYIVWEHQTLVLVHSNTVSHTSYAPGWEYSESEKQTWVCISNFLLSPQSQNSTSGCLLQGAKKEHFPESDNLGLNCSTSCQSYSTDSLPVLHACFRFLLCNTELASACSQMLLWELNEIMHANRQCLVTFPCGNSFLDFLGN